MYNRLLFLVLILLMPYSAAAEVTANLTDSPKIIAGNKAEIKFSLGAKEKPITFDNLREVHTKKIHALVINPDLTDYTHAHPMPTSKAGEYEFSFTPKTDNTYKIWLDITLADGAHQYIPLVVNGTKGGKIEKKQVTKASVEGYDFTLSFDSELKTGVASMGSLQVSKEGKPFAQLEPLMGAFAHIVGFYDDYKTIAHIHPMGAEPETPQERGGPELAFHIEPERAGFIKLFAQVQINGQDLYVPFGVLVK